MARVKYTAHTLQTAVLQRRYENSAPRQASVATSSGGGQLLTRALMRRLCWANELVVAA